MEKIIDIIESIANEKNLDINEVKEKVKLAITNTVTKIYGEKYNFFVDTNKNVGIYQKIIVVADNDERLNEDNEHYISISKAKEQSEDVEVGDELTYEINLENLGRTAASLLHKELEYHIQKLLEEKIFQKYQAMVGGLVFGSVTRVDSEENTFLEIDEVKAILPRKYRIKGEKFKVGDVVKAVIKRVIVDKAHGLRVEISRTSPKFLEALLTLEVPELKDGAISIQGCARIPGERAKLVIAANTPSVDAIGACVGIKGVRINAVSKELHGESIDCIEYSDQDAILISRTLAPAIINSVVINENKATVSLDFSQKSKAIGKSGINIRLCSMLTGYEIELQEIGTSKTEENTSQENISSEEALNNLKDLFKNI